ncbi:MAG: hypothetical protein NTX53_14435 [candidate division WOR-3 bacterium]|nr:hypothetical protein [candidate division WOR-3 bacterium]
MIERQMLKLAVAMAMMCGLASASVVGYHVEPVKASWSGHTDTIPPNNYVAQTVTCNFDSLSYVELFAGAKGDSGTYTATVYDGNTQLMTSDGSQDHDCRWVRFEDWDQQVAFTKGKTLTIRFTRGGNDNHDNHAV